MTGATVSALLQKLAVALTTRLHPLALEISHAIGDELLPSAISAAMDINFGDDNAKMTEALVERLRLLHPQGQAEGVPTDLDHELQRALADDEEWQRASEIERLTPGLSPEQLRSALKATLAIHHHWALNRALRALVPRLTPDLLASALEAVTSIGDVAVRSEALGILAPWLPPALLPSALDAASAIRDDLPRVEALGELAGLLFSH